MAGTAYVVLAHKNPAQVGRLVGALNPSPVYLHVDRRTPGRLASAIASEAGAAGLVATLPRFPTPWASWNLVVAALTGLDRAVRDGADHVVCMSGQDYVLAGPHEIDAFLAGFQDCSFLPSTPVPTPILGADGGMSRFRYWHVPLGGKKVRLPLRRGVPRGLEPYWHQAQWCLASGLAEEIVAAWRRDPQLTRYFRRVWIPDETFVGTLAHRLGSSSIMDENLWYVRWSPGASHPDVLDETDLPDLLRATVVGSDVGGSSRRKLFARKFDVGADTTVLDRLDDHLTAGVAGGNDG
jgi:hypothetical protein